MPTPALAVDCVQPASPDPIVDTSAVDVLTCVNTVTRTGDGIDPDAINLSTTNAGFYVYANNSGILTSAIADGIHTETDGIGAFTVIVNSEAITAGSDGISALTNANQSDIDITNVALITAGTGFNALTNGNDSDIVINNEGAVNVVSQGIQAATLGTSATITITNSGDIQAGGTAIDAYTRDVDSFVLITNRGALTAGFGIQAETHGERSTITINNYAGINATTDAIFARTYDANATITINNYANLTSNSGDGIDAETNDEQSAIFVLNAGIINSDPGILLQTNALNSRIDVRNTGDIAAVHGGIVARTYAALSPIDIRNTANIESGTDAIYARTNFGDSNIAIQNTGDITAVATAINAQTTSSGSPIDILSSGNLTVGDGGTGIVALTTGRASPITVTSSSTFITGEHSTAISARTQDRYSPIGIFTSGDMTQLGAGSSHGIDAETIDIFSPIDVVNGADIITTGYAAHAIRARTQAANSALSVQNSGDILTTGEGAFGIVAYTNQTDSALTILNTGNTRATGDKATAIFAQAQSAGSPVSIGNTGTVFGNARGVYAYSVSGTTIVNSGTISAGSLLAIEVTGLGNAKILNEGEITGFVQLDANDAFINQDGGTFEARLTSDFGPGTDLFRNEQGGTVHTAANANVAEITRFVNLERFENRGQISLVDGAAGDVFQIANAINGTGLNFVGSGRSTLAVDSFLGGAGSVSDTLVIDGNASGKTVVTVNNTNSGPGSFNKSIPVVYVNGPNVTGNEFSLVKPIDTGFYDYDLFFRPTGSGVFELRSFAGAGAYVLPQVITATLDIWHEGSDTWFDRTADLRVLLAGGAAPTAYDPGGKSLSEAPAPSLTPAVWTRASGNWLDREGSETTTAYGRTYRYNLDRDLETIDFQMGLDLGTRDLFSRGDILVFGVLGGFVHADLDYDQINRAFDYDGGQVGGYATYLNGGLFVDTLLNAQLFEIDPNGALGFPSSLDATNVGLRTDTGYRFGSFTGGGFIEPLATIAVNWVDIEGFSLGGNTVSFDDDPNVRGRLGLRVGTTKEAWTGTMMEPFVTGSLWGHLSDDSQATLVSSGTTFRFEDSLEDVWGEVSVGVNFFNVSQTTSLFAKVDVTFGEDVEGVGGKAGMRVSW